MRITLANYLAELQACKESITWAIPYETNWEKAWQECQRADWMLWLIGKTINCPPWTDGRKPLLATCLDIAETNKHLWTETVIANVAVLRQWTLGKASTEEAQKAKIALWDATAAAVAAAADVATAAYATVYAANAAAYANAAADAAYAANAAADAAYAAADAAYAAYAADVVRLKKLAEYADIVRKQWYCGENQVIKVN